MSPVSRWLLCAVAILVCAGGAAGAGAAIPPANALPSAASATGARLIVSPDRNAVIKRSSAKVVINRPAGAKLIVRLGRRNVTGLFHSQGANLAARLGPGSGAKYGINHLFVLAKRSGRRPLTHTRSFYLVRRRNGFVQVKVPRETPQNARVEIASGKSHLAAARRSRTVHFWLNGQRVNRAATTNERTHYKLSPSLAHGLHFGSNRLRVVVVEPEQGRFARIDRRFRVSRRAPLANAGPDRSGYGRMRIPLGGRGRAARGGDLTYRWVIVRKPKGSHPRLAGAKRARPKLFADHPGHYRLRQLVGERGRSTGAAARASASAAGRAGSDDVGVTVSPQTPMVEIAANDQSYEPRGIQIGGTYYAHTGPGASIQWLTLDRATLQPVQSGNSWCCDQDQHTLDTLHRQLSCKPGAAGPSGSTSSWS